MFDLYSFVPLSRKSAFPPDDEMTLIRTLKGEACLQLQNKVNVYKYVNALPFPISQAKIKEFIPRLSLKKKEVNRRPNYSSVEGKRTPPSPYYFFFVLRCGSQLWLLPSFVP